MVGLPVLRPRGRLFGVCGLCCFRRRRHGLRITAVPGRRLLGVRDLLGLARLRLRGNGRRSGARRTATPGRGLLGRLLDRLAEVLLGRHTLPGLVCLGCLRLRTLYRLGRGVGLGDLHGLSGLCGLRCLGGLARRGRRRRIRGRRDRRANIRAWFLGAGFPRAGGTCGVRGGFRHVLLA